MDASAGPGARTLRRRRIAANAQKNAAIAAEAEDERPRPRERSSRREEDRAARPLQRGRETRHGARQDLEPPKVVDPARVEPEGEGARARGRRGGGRRGPSPPPRRSRSRARGSGPQDRRRRRRGGRSARTRTAMPMGASSARAVILQAAARPIATPGQRRRPQPGTILRDPDGAEKRRRGEGRQERVDGPEVRELDAEHAEGRQAGGDRSAARRCANRRVMR